MRMLELHTSIFQNYAIKGTGSHAGKIVVKEAILQNNTIPSY